MNASPKALEELKKVLNSEEVPAAGIRIFTQQGCCGPAVQMSVVEKPSSGDLQLSIDSVNFFIEESARDTMTEVTIDYGSNGFILNGMKRSGGGGCCG
jgi:Fe-S cluster assembly iron-binding protein IscA